MTTCCVGDGDLLNEIVECFERGHDSHALTLEVVDGSEAHIITQTDHARKKVKGSLLLLEAVGVRIGKKEHELHSAAALWQLEMLHAAEVIGRVGSAHIHLQGSHAH